MIGAFSQRLGRLHKFARSAGPVRGPRLLWQITRKSSPVLASLPGGRAIELRPRTSDQYMLEEVFIDRAYDVGLDFEPAYVVDAGANIGCYTAWVATRHPHARIVAVEPDPGIGTLLREQGLSRIDLLKVDIEGAERELFEGDTGWMAVTRAVLIELHDRTKPGCEEAFLRAARLHGFACRKHSDIMVARREAA